MTAETVERLGGVFCDVLAKMAFMFGDPVAPCDLPDPAGAVFTATMDIAGARRGALTLTAPEALCPDLAANILGLEPQAAQVAERALDALQELLNVTCGHVLTALAGEEAVFDLAPPRTARADGAAWRALRDAPDTAAFVIEGHPVMLSLRLEA